MQTIYSHCYQGIFENFRSIISPLTLQWTDENIFLLATLMLFQLPISPVHSERTVKRAFSTGRSANCTQAAADPCISKQKTEKTALPDPDKGLKQDRLLSSEISVNPQAAVSYSNSIGRFLF